MYDVCPKHKAYSVDIASSHFFPLLHRKLVDFVILSDHIGQFMGSFLFVLPVIFPLTDFPAP